MWGRITQGGDAFIREHVNHHIEFQTLRRLPSCSDHILFTVRRFQNPMSVLERHTGAAAALAAAIRRKNTSSLIRNGLAVQANGEAILGFLERVVERGGSRDGSIPSTDAEQEGGNNTLLAGVVKEPWERRTLRDGTKHSEVDPSTGVVGTPREDGDRYS